MKCAWHICKNTIVSTKKGPSKKYCCTKCKNKGAVHTRRKKLKLLAVKHLGGKCQNCGYDKCIGALEFHHRDPGEKDFQISNGNTRSLDKLLVEVDKCLLLCANCHRELHYGNSEPSKDRNIFEGVETRQTSPDQVKLREMV
ncbi:HNHc domain containing protein [uncultured Caudovirales phage]|uniref:HNHc domain containing protein n=1 Tax=uncultured Caudovirales phage TaxID=2100421 RepID=A0A6J5M7D9_9CAUD|nr:HNHc domain containing protein [uncultured Caudovirales phage]